MVSLKNRSKGFTIVELLIVIVVIAILATLVIVTFTGIQQKARDSQRQTDINAVDTHVEGFYASYGFYPTWKDMTTASFVSRYMKGLDPQALVDPKGPTQTLANSATPTADQYAYHATSSVTGVTCDNDTATVITDPDNPVDNHCDGFTLSAQLESGSVYTKQSN